MGYVATFDLPDSCLLMIIYVDDEVEFWEKNDNDLDADFPPSVSPDTPRFDLNEPALDQEQEVFIWWVITFTCIFQTLHMLSSRAVQ